MTTITLIPSDDLECSEATGEMFNEDRASMAGQFIAAMKPAYYWGGELDYVVAKDLIQNLCHFLHQMSDEDIPEYEHADDRQAWVFDLLLSAWEGYIEEMDIERAADEEADREETT